MVNQEETGYIRSIMDFNYPEQGVPIDEVESVDSIVHRFKTGAMSLTDQFHRRHMDTGDRHEYAAW